LGGAAAPYPVGALGRAGDIRVGASLGERAGGVCVDTLVVCHTLVRRAVPIARGGQRDDGGVRDRACWSRSRAARSPVGALAEAAMVPRRRNGTGGGLLVPRALAWCWRAPGRRLLRATFELRELRVLTSGAPSARRRAGDRHGADRRAGSLGALPLRVEHSATTHRPTTAWRMRSGIRCSR
jgi:hypothetical protein